MKTFYRLSFVVAFLFIAAPAAFAELNQMRDDIPPSMCGEIDPDRACYYEAGGTTDCPARTSYDTCMARCDCQFDNNKKKCKSSPSCISLATSERNACYGACASDFS